MRDTRKDSFHVSYFAILWRIWTEGNTRVLSNNSLSLALVLWDGVSVSCIALDFGYKIF